MEKQKEKLKTNLQHASINRSRNDNSITIHLLGDWTCSQPEDSLASQTWRWAKRSSETVGEESEEVVRDGWSRRSAALEKSLVGGNEDARGSVLLAISCARGVRIVSSRRLVDTGAVQVHLCQGLGYLSIVVDDYEIIIPWIISMLTGKRMNDSLTVAPMLGGKVGKHWPVAPDNMLESHYFDRQSYSYVHCQ